MAKKRIKRNDRYSNTYNLGGWMNGVNNKIDASSFGKAIGGSSGLGGITNAATSIVSGLINPRGNSTGVGNTLQGIGSIASNIPGIGGVIGAGVNLVGGLINAAFGSNLNEEFIAQTEDKTKQQAGYISSAEDNASLLSDWTSYTDMAHVKRSDVGSDGWFSNKAKNKTKALNRAIDEANLRAWHSLNNTASNVDTNNDFLAMANFSAYGGPIFSTGAIGYDLASRDLNNKQMKALGDMRLTSLPNSFNAMPDVSTINTFKDGGIFIKPENRGKFTALKERTGKSSTWYKEHGTPAQKKMATFSLNAAKWKHADGGELHIHGGDFTNGLTYIDNGGSHEANPFEGVQMGIDPQGVPNLVEEGEVIFNDYVFSNRLKVPKAIRQKYKLRDNITFADAAKKLSKESEDRPNDPISKRGLETFMSALANSQEEVRIKNGGREMNRYAKGGKLGNLFSGEEDHPSVLKGLEFPYLEPTASDIPVLEGLSIEGLKPLDMPEKRKSKNSYLRYAPIAASGIAVLNDMLGGNEPNYTNADIFAKAIRDSYRPVSTRPIGEYLSYKPFDRMFYINQLNKNSAANRRAIQNTSGGNRAAALASLLALDYNYGENLGKLGRQAEEYNQALKEKVTDFNRRTNMYNSEQGTKVDMFNSELKAKQAGLYGQLAGMRQSILNSNMEEKRENMTNFIQGLGDLGREMEQKKWRKALYNTGYFGKSKELEQLLGII